MFSRTVPVCCMGASDRKSPTSRRAVKSEISALHRELNGLYSVHVLCEFLCCPKWSKCYSGIYMENVPHIQIWIF